MLSKNLLAYEQTNSFYFTIKRFLYVRHSTSQTSSVKSLQDIVKSKMSRDRSYSYCRLNINHVVGNQITANLHMH